MKITEIESYLNNYGPRLRKARKNHGFTILNLAKVARINRSIITKYELGKKKLTVKQALKLEKAAEQLGIEV